MIGNYPSLTFFVVNFPLNSYFLQRVHKRLSCAILKKKKSSVTNFLPSESGKLRAFEKKKFGD